MFLLAFLGFWGYVLWSIAFYVLYRPRSVAGNKVVITGGGSGIGRLLALKFAKRGAKVILWDVNKDGMAAVQKEITDAGGDCATYFVDVSDRALVYATAKAVGDIQILINNAGIVTGKTLLECPDELMEKTVQVNTISHFWTIKAFLPAMLKANNGHIVTVASAAGLYGVAGLVDYCASKFGAVGTAEALYMELKKQKTKVMSTHVCPYYINTGMFDGVKTKYPAILPILEPDWVAERMVTGILRGEEWIVAPAISWIMLPAKILPVPWCEYIGGLLGLSDGMNDFKGRANAAQAKKAQ